MKKSRIQAGFFILNNIIKKLNQLYIKLFIANACDIILLLIKIQQHLFKMHL